MRFPIISLPLALLALASGCRKAEVASYRVPHETPEPLPPILTGAAGSAGTAVGAAPSMAGTAVPTADGSGLSWEAPTHWTPKAASAMRKGSYSVPGTDGGEAADFAITAFPGDVGGDLANFNRWRGQIELLPLTEAELPGASEHLDFNGLHFTVVEFANPTAAKPQRILGALVPFEGATWFFKLMGPDALVAREKPAFLEFLKTVHAPNATQP